MPDNKQRVVAVIPCFNTAPHVSVVVGAARKYVDEVIVVDDGSTDDTARLAREAGARVISHGKNLGYGKAIKTCFESGLKAKANALIIIDGDGQHQPEEIPNLVQPVLENRADLVIGSRFLGSNQVIPDYRRFGIKIITWLFNAGSKTKVSDAQSGFRAYSSKAINSLQLSEDGMGVSIEILEKARRNKLIIIEVPITCKYHHTSMTYNAVKHGLKVAMDVLRIRFRSYRKPKGV